MNIAGRKISNDEITEPLLEIICYVIVYYRVRWQIMRNIQKKKRIMIRIRIMRKSILGGM